MSEKHPFVTHLESLREDRAALACLRRGLGRPPGTVADMFRYVARFASHEEYRSREDAYYTLAALFGSHPAGGGTGNMGDHFARTARGSDDATAIERRFTRLLAAHPDDLAFYLRQAVSFLQAKEVPINWNQLFSDMLNWGRPDGRVQRAWARAYWGRALPEDATDQDKENQED